MSNESNENCKVCHSPSEGYFEELVLAAKESASNGCTLCSVIFSFICSLWEGSIISTNTFRLRIRKGLPAILEVNYGTMVIAGSMEPVFASYQLYMLANAPRPQSLSSLSSIGIGGQIAANAGSEECFTFAKFCLNRCLRTHASCKQPPTSNSPRRVIDIGEDNSSMKLLEPDVLEAQYATLSHCWGGHQGLTTTKALLPSRKLHIAWNALPPTFQDAVTVARKMEIRYLWIDSLCIIQDDPEDWQIESSKMAGIYRDSLLTIAAVSSPSSSRSFLMQRPQMAPRLYQLQAPDILEDGSQKFYIAIREGDLHSKIGPLNERAWVFQEEKLSTRILYYAESELTFECREWTCCECGMTAVDNRQKDPFKVVADPRAFTISGNAKSDPCTLWQGIITEYSQRSLTFSKDRLPALSGIASVFGRLTQSPYLAGLWESHLILDLLWRSGPKPPADISRGITDQYRAPTFSWASIGRGVYYRDVTKWPGFRYDTSVVRASCTPQGLNPFGEVTAGFIEVKGPFAEVSLATRPGNSAGSYLLKSVEAFVELQSDVPLVRDIIKDASGIVKDTARRTATGENVQTSFRTPAWCLSLLSSSNGAVNEVLVLGLSKTVPGAYERLGLIDSSVVQNKGKLYKLFSNARMTTIKIV